MYKSVLIISDNVEICKKVKLLIENKSFKETNFTFSISPFSDKADFKVIDGDILVYDLKCKTDVFRILEKYDLVMSIHCKQIFPDIMVDNLKCVNIHPGYNPINRGWYPQVFSIINDTPIGATIHEIDKKLDHGNIIDRKFVEKKTDDTSLTLYNRIVNTEIKLLENNLKNIINNTYEVIIPEIEGDLFLKNDFNKLCELDLYEELTLGKAIDKLRALTHGTYKNAYFIDEKDGMKVYVTINLDKND